MKKILILFILLLLVVGCGNKETTPQATPTPETIEETTEEIKEETPTVSEEPKIIEVVSGDIGSGPATLDLVYGLVYVPEGLDYEVYDLFATKDDPFGKNTLDFGIDRLDNRLDITSMLVVPDLDAAVEEFLYRNDYATEDVEMKDDIIINGKTYKHAYYVEDEIDYLITIYEYSDAFNYVEVSFNSLDLNDPLAQEFLNGLQIPKE